MVFIRRETPATYAAQKAPSSSAAKGLVYYVPGAVVWKGWRTAATDLLLSTYGVVIDRRVVGNAELNSPSKPEYVLLDKYICNKKETRTEAPKYSQSERGHFAYSLKEPTAAF